MTDPHITSGPSASGDARPARGARKRYEAPRLVDYGAINKLTQSGGVTIRDQGSMFQRAP